MTTQYIYDLTDTWNAGGTVFNAIKMNVTDSASAAGSKLLELQKDSVSFFNVGKNGNVGIGLASPSYLFHVQNASADASAFIGQTASRGLFWQWRYNATAASAFGEISTFGGDNALRIQAQSGGGNTVLNLQSGNVGIGTSSPSRKLTVVGSANFTDGTNDVTLWNDGMAGTNASIAFRLATGGTERMRIGTTGNVAIGTTSTTYRLNISSTNAGIYVATAGATGGLPSQYWVDSVHGVDAILSTISTGVWFGAYTNSPLMLVTNNTERARITNAGNFGIGTTSPLTPLQVGGVPYSSSFYGLTGGNVFVAGASAVPSKTQRGNLHIESTDVNSVGVGPSITFGLNASQFVSEYVIVGGSIKTQVVGTSNLDPQPAMVFSVLAGTASSGTLTERMRIDSLGNVGIGTTPSASWGAPFRALVIGGNSFIVGRTDSIAGRQLQIGTNAFFNGTSWIYGASQPAAKYYQNDGQHIWEVAGSGTAGNAITFTQAMTMDSSGNLGIGTTSPQGRIDVAGGARVSGQSTFTTGVGLEIQYISASNTSLMRSYDRGASTYRNVTIGAQNHTFIIDDVTEVLRLTVNKSVVVGNAAIATNATNGFLYVPSCAGTPTGTPTSFTGTVPIVVDTTNNKLYFYSGGAWRDAGP